MVCVRAPTDTAKTGEILGQALGAPPWVCSAAFCGLLAAMCYWLKPGQLDKANGILLAAVLASFAVCARSCHACGMNSHHAGPHAGRGGAWEVMIFAWCVLQGLVGSMAGSVVCSRLEVRALSLQTPNSILLPAAITPGWRSSAGVAAGAEAAALRVRRAT